MTASQQPSHALYARVLAAVATTPAPTMRTSTRMHAALGAVVFVVAAVIVTASLAVYGRAAAGLELGLQSRSSLLAVSCLLGATTVVATAIAVFRSSSGLGARALWLVFVSAFVPTTHVVLILSGTVHIPDFAMASVEVSPWGLRCLAIAMLVGVIALGCFGAALHRAVPVASRLRGAALGAAAGAWAGLAVFGFCPSDDLQHLAIGHVLPVFVLTSLGASALARVLRP